jgi:hypothetical protein
VLAQRGQEYLVEKGAVPAGDAQQQQYAERQFR